MLNQRLFRSQLVLNRKLKLFKISFALLKSMNEGFRTYEGLNTLRPIIPTPNNSANALRMDSSNELEKNPLLKHYIDNYNRLMRQKTVLNNQITIINNQKQELSRRLQLLKKDQDNKKKRHRRNASQISRNFECPIADCGRNYGSQGSLLQHIKIKHKQFYESDEYEKLLLSKNKKKQQLVNKAKYKKQQINSSQND